jgi:hypothetical protein
VATDAEHDGLATCTAPLNPRADHINDGARRDTACSRCQLVRNVTRVAQQGEELVVWWLWLGVVRGDGGVVGCCGGAVAVVLVVLDPPFSYSASLRNTVPAAHPSSSSSSSSLYRTMSLTLSYHSYTLHLHKKVLHAAWCSRSPPPLYAWCDGHSRHRLWSSAPRPVRHPAGACGGG